MVLAHSSGGVIVSENRGTSYLLRTYHRPEGCVGEVEKVHRGGSFCSYLKNIAVTFSGIPLNVPAAYLIWAFSNPRGGVQCDNEA